MGIIPKFRSDQIYPKLFGYWTQNFPFSNEECLETCNGWVSFSNSTQANPLYYWAMKYWGYRYNYVVKSWRAKRLFKYLAFHPEILAPYMFHVIHIFAGRYFHTMKGLLWHCEVLGWECFSSMDILVGPSSTRSPSMVPETSQLKKAPCKNATVPKYTLCQNFQLSI